MGPYARLAALRLGDPLAALQAIIGAGKTPGADGRLSVTYLDARFDINGLIAALNFSPGFPTNIRISGLHIGMTLDALAQDPRGFTPEARHALPKGHRYAATLPNGDTVTAFVNRDGLVRMIEFNRPSAAFPPLPYANADTHGISLRSYTDNAELLADWAGASAHARPDNAAGNTHEIALAEAHWLQNEATPYDWHAYATSYNWDGGEAPLLWIIRQPGCEKATALHVFYLARPGQNLDYAFDTTSLPSWGADAHELILEIRDRFMSGFYTSATIAFDTAQALREESYLPEDPDEAAYNHLIPPLMREPIPGRAFTHTAKPIDYDRFPRATATLRPPPPVQK
jgi:hypothetical protein